MSTTVLVQYGTPGFVGRFRATAGAVARDEQVVVRTPRGVELGTVLCEPADGAEPPDGDVLRTATDADAVPCGDELLAAASSRAEELELPLAFVDIELTLDGTAILHALPWDVCDATGLFEELAARFGVAVRLFDLSRAPAAKDEPQPTGCGKPGCGSDAGEGGCSSCGTGGGCSTGSCSRGAVKNPDELTAYFADLRQKMDAAGFGRTPLV